MRHSSQEEEEELRGALYMRNIRRLLVGSGLLVTVGCASATAPVPESSRTGMVTEVKIGEVLTPKVSNAKTDDEVRWINATNSPVHMS